MVNVTQAVQSRGMLTMNPTRATATARGSTGASLTQAMAKADSPRTKPNPSHIESKAQSVDQTLRPHPNGPKVVAMAAKEIAKTTDAAQKITALRPSRADQLDAQARIPIVAMSPTAGRIGANNRASRPAPWRTARLVSMRM